MPPEPDISGPLGTYAARDLVRKILREGVTRFSQHARDEMEKDDLSTMDCTNVLRGGTVEPPELERGSWRYRVLTNRMCVVVAFRSKNELVVITAWRIRER
jgi:hypothetical protein